MIDFTHIQHLEYILPIIIFFSRIFDVTLGTMRIIFVNKGLRFVAPIIGFFEVLIWLIIIGQIMQNINSPINYLAYAGGFATGNYVGILIEQRIAMGMTLIRIITRKMGTELIQEFRKDGYRVTHVPAEGNRGRVEIIFLPVPRREISTVISKVKKYNPNALYTVEDVREMSSWAVPQTNYGQKYFQRPMNRLFRFKRKSK